MDPVAALAETAFWLERQQAASHRVKAFRRAAKTLAGLSDAELAELRDAEPRDIGAWHTIGSLGKASVEIITASVHGEVPERLARLRVEGSEPLTTAGADIRRALRGDLHCHSDWSDGTASLAEMVQVAQGLGHEYLAITDHSPRLTVARGLSAERLREQLGVLDELERQEPGITILRGIEVDILGTGALDQEAALLDELDVVVASVHSQLRMDSESMTHRMVAAVANPRTNVLGHCTGRLVGGERGTRPPSVFDAEVVFEACRQFQVAVEINAKPERQDPPDDLLALAVDMGCHFAIDSDAHAPGHLDFQQLGAARAEALGVPVERIINTWPLDRLQQWCSGA